jgi:hypothetical protein
MADEPILGAIAERLHALVGAQSIEPHRAYLNDPQGLQKDINDLLSMGTGGLIVGIEEIGVDDDEPTPRPR